MYVYIYIYIYIYMHIWVKQIVRRAEFVDGEDVLGLGGVAKGDREETYPPKTTLLNYLVAKGD